MSMEDNNLDRKIEALLFFQGEELSLSFLANHLGVSPKRISEALEVLKERLKHSALTLVENNNSLLLTTRSEFSDLLDSLVEEEENTDLSQPALEALSIILYQSPISKAQIDEIRGINSAYILRRLMIRGLISRRKEGIRNLYSPTTDLLRFLGVDSIESLPAYQEVVERIKQIEASQQEPDRLVQ